MLGSANQVNTQIVLKYKSHFGWSVIRSNFLFLFIDSNAAKNNNKVIDADRRYMENILSIL